MSSRSAAAVPELLAFADPDNLCTCFFLKPDIMFCQKHCGLILQDQFFNLYPWKHARSVTCICAMSVTSDLSNGTKKICSAPEADYSYK